MNWDFSDFHFIRPLYLTAIPGLILIWWALGRSLKSTAWDKVISKEMLDVLRVQAGSGITLWRWGLLFAWILMALASAGPSWTKIPAPSYKNQLATVVLFDLSRSMMAEDLSPNRLTRAKFKLIDLLRQQKDGQIALIAYAGDAYAVSPLTDDPRTIEALLPALNPSIMPSQGSNAEAAVALASQLLRDAKIAAGNILMLTDGVSPESQRTIVSDLPKTHTLSIIGIGSSEATPIPAARGGFLKASNGELVLTKLNVTELRDLAQSSNGAYANIQNDDSDISELLSEKFDAGARQQKNDPETDNRFDSWADMGHWLVFIVLPFAAFAFRRGLVFMLPLMFMGSLFSPEISYAQESSEPSEASEPKFEWSHLWKTADQRAADLFAQGDYQNAAKTFKNKAWKASSKYKNSDYQNAQKEFEQSTDIDSQYNRANSLALQGQFKEAIEAYQSILEQDPNNEDAAFNKSILEQAQDQQDQSQDQQNQDQESQDRQDQDNQDQGNKSEQNPDDQDKQDQENPEQKDSQDQSSEQNDSDKPEQEEQDQSEKPEQQSEQEKEQEKKEKQEQQAKDQQEKEQSEKQSEEKSVEPIDTPEDLGDASEQWLRGIPDDPSGFLRKKFKYQKEQRRKQGGNRDNDAKQAERY